ncbi:hypothetical protein ABZW11_14680 [Nonomuraea sp. NPDC004580]|uniref:hypothetical protein n=1 Tax=Nonomuraea sp. NPDC004580 TaxID=3154552 RepID=UPI0033AFA55D
MGIEIEDKFDVSPDYELPDLSDGIERGAAERAHVGFPKVWKTCKAVAKVL